MFELSKRDALNVDRSELNRSQVVAGCLSLNAKGTESIPHPRENDVDAQPDPALKGFVSTDVPPHPGLKCIAWNPCCNFSTE